jgi:hypothetical protein
MPNGAKIIRFCAMLAAFMLLSAMAGCPNSSDFQNGNQHTDGPTDHSGPGSGGMGQMGGGMGGMGMP